MNEKNNSTVTNESNRIKLLEQSINIDHLNNEERYSLMELGNNFYNLFFLEGDNLTITEILTHNINTPTLTKPINIISYRLPWTY